MKFNMGDKVQWDSHSAGYVKHKEGNIVEVVPAGAHPTTKWTPSYVGVRKYESYVVQVKSKLYWPLVLYLKPISISIPSAEVL